jgi:hypothetical protein
MQSRLLRHVRLGSRDAAGVEQPGAFRVNAHAQRGLIAAFSLELVKTGRVDAELGRALNKAAEVRLIADYMAASV